MESLMIRCGYQGVLDSSLLALQAGQSHSRLGTYSQRPIIRCVSCDDALPALENNEIDLAIVTLDEVISRTCKGTSTSLRIVGRLLGGDLRAFVAFSKPTDDTGLETTSLAAANPEVTASRWEEISCALDLDSSKTEVKHIPPSQLYSEITSEQFSFAELNMHWEGLLALRKGIVNQCINPTHFGLPGSFSHLIVAKAEFINTHRDWLLELREEIASFYREVLAAQFKQKSHEVLSASAAWVECTQRDGFLAASLRVLAPHFEEFLRCKGALRWEDVVPYFCWFEKNVAQRHRQGEVPTTAIHLEQLLCECWS